jgi:hypothetical protein
MAELVQGGLHQAERNRRRRHRRSDAEVVMKQLALTRLALVASTLLGLGMAAYADYTIRDAETGQPIVVEAFDCGGKVCPQSTLVDQFGQPIGIAGNPFFFGGTVQANLTTFAAAPVATLQRSANTTTYTVNTAWNNSAAPAFFTFANACSGNGKQVLVPQIDIWSTANPALKLQGVLWLFSGVPTTNIVDNGNCVIAPADYDNLTGPSNGIVFALANSQAAAATNSGVSLVGNTYQMQCDPNSTSITGMVQVTLGYVPASGETLKIRLRTAGLNN